MQWLTNGNLIVSEPQFSDSVFFVPSDVGKIFHFESVNTLTGEHETDIADFQYSDVNVGCWTGMTMRFEKDSQHLIVAGPQCHNHVGNEERRVAGRVFLFKL